MNNLRKVTAIPIILSKKSNFGLLGSSFHSSPMASAGQEWRRSRFLPLNPNSYGPFADLPDYTFLDGRPTPAGKGKVDRALKHRELAKKIVQLTSEVDFAVQRHSRLQKEEQDKRDAILSRKLKPKGRKSRTAPQQ